MFSLVVGPSQGKPDAVADLQLLLTTSPKAYDDWQKLPITRMILGALDETSKGRAPHPNLQVTDYAQAVGEVIGFQRAIVALRDPTAFLESLGTSVGPKREPLPEPSYAAPEPPPETQTKKPGVKKEK